MDRGIIKWQPFNSCFRSDEIIENIAELKKRVDFPNLSEDQINELEEIIMESYNLKIMVNIEYYYDGFINCIKGKINFLNAKEKKLAINNKTIYFKQILKIREF